MCHATSALCYRNLAVEFMIFVLRQISETLELYYVWLERLMAKKDVTEAEFVEPFRLVFRAQQS